MINVVHKQALQVDQWTGESITTRFKIPRKGGKCWGGCYGTPSTALSALAHYIDSNPMSVDEAHELYDLFQASLRRVPEYSSEKFTSVPAPSYKNLQMWGGNMSLEEYHAVYDHEFQAKAMTQEIIGGVVEPDTEKAGDTNNKRARDEMGLGTEIGEDKRPANAPKLWRLTEQLEGGQSKELRVDMPRCAGSFVEFLRKNVADPAIPGAVVVYLHPHQPNIFALGSPGDYAKGVNRMAVDMLGHVPVFGNVRVYHKNKLRDGKRRRTPSQIQ